MYSACPPWNSLCFNFVFWGCGSCCSISSTREEHTRELYKLYIMLSKTDTNLIHWIPAFFRDCKWKPRCKHFDANSAISTKTRSGAVLAFLKLGFRQQVKTLTATDIMRTTSERIFLWTHWTANAHFVPHVFQPAKLSPHALEDESELPMNCTTGG